MPSVAVLGLNRFGEQIYDYLTSHDETTVLGLFTEESQYTAIQKLEPEYLISAGFDHIIPDEILEVPTEDVINLHPSYLPYNRGVNPDIWSIVREEKAGVSIHYVTSEIDAGPILSRQEVEVKPSDTARTLRKRLDERIVEMFIDEWENIYSGTVSVIEQDPLSGTSNHSSDLESLCEIDLDRVCTVEDTITKLRALTFPPYYNSYFEKDGEKYFVRVSITPKNELDVDSFEWDTPTLFNG